MRMRAQRGFTLIEVIIVIAMMSILSAMAYYYLGNKGHRGQLRSAAAELVGHMNLARVGAIRDTRPWAIEFNPGGNSYEIFNDSGEDFAPEDPSDPVDWTDDDEILFRTANLPQNVRFGSSQGMLDGVPVDDGVSFGNNRIIFWPNGTCSESGTVYLTTVGGSTFAVTSFSATGRVRVRSNDGSGWSN